MKSYLIVMAFLAMTLSSYAATFVSANSGAWNDGATWGNTSPGIAGIDYPGQTDDIIIQAPHIVTVDTRNANGGPANSPEGLGRPNVGDGVVNGSQSFPSAEAQMFLHQGNISIQGGATLQFNVPVIFDDTLLIQGTLRTSGDVVNLGYLNATSSATLDIGDDFIMSGNSVTDIDGNISTGDDLYIDHLSAILGGSGSLNINDDIQTFNPRNHNPRPQICSYFTVGCAGDCDPSSGGNQASVIGTSAADICADILPVEFVDFTAMATTNFEVHIQWSTAAEINSAYFEVLHSQDGLEWTVIDVLQAAGQSESLLDYTSTHLDPQRGQVHYYQVRQVDFDGSSMQTDVVSIELAALPQTGLQIFPNPVRQNQAIQIVNNKTIQQVEIFNLHGQRISLVTSPVNNQISTSFLKTGIYLLNITLEDGEIIIKKVQVL